MNDRERAALAEQILANPLVGLILDEMEASAVEALVHAKTEQTRVEAQWRVRATRSFREDCLAMLGNTRPKKAAPA